MPYILLVEFEKYDIWNTLEKVAKLKGKWNWTDQVIFFIVTK